MSKVDLSTIECPAIDLQILKEDAEENQETNEFVTNEYSSLEEGEEEGKQAFHPQKVHEDDYKSSQKKRERSVSPDQKSMKEGSSISDDRPAKYLLREDQQQSEYEEDETVLELIPISKEELRLLDFNEIKKDLNQMEKIKLAREFKQWRSLRNKTSKSNNLMHYPKFGIDASWKTYCSYVNNGTISSEINKRRAYRQTFSLSSLKQDVHTACKADRIECVVYLHESYCKRCLEERCIPPTGTANIYFRKKGTEETESLVTQYLKVDRDQQGRMVRESNMTRIHPQHQVRLPREDSQGAKYLDRGYTRSNEHGKTELRTPNPFAQPLSSQDLPDYSHLTHVSPPTDQGPYDQRSPRRSIVVDRRSPPRVEGQDGYERSRGVTTLDNALLLFQTQVYRRFDDFSSRLGSLESRLNEKLLELQKEKFVYDDKVRDLEKQASRAVSEYQKSKKNVVDLSAEVRKNKMKIELLSSQLEFYRQGLSKRNLKDQKLADQNKE